LIISEKITVTKPNIKYQRKLDTKFVNLPISIEKAKPYFKVQLKMQDTYIESKMLIDIGNSDAIWVFQNYILMGLLCRRRILMIF